MSYNFSKFISCKFFCVVLRVFYIMFSANNCTFLSSLVAFYLWLVSYFCLIALARTSSIMLSESGIPVLFLILEESLRIFTIEYNGSCKFVIYGFHCVGVHSLCISFLMRVFVINWCWHHVCFIMVLICISLMISNVWVPFHLTVSHLNVFFGKWSIRGTLLIF